MKTNGVDRALAILGTACLIAALSGCASKPQNSAQPPPAAPAANKDAPDSAGEGEKASRAARPAASLFDGSNEPFQSHRGGAFSSYVSLTLPPEPARAFLPEVEAFAKEKLKNRGEAHVTAITPPEFHDALGNLLTIPELDAIAGREHLQQARIKPICLGVAQADPEGHLERAYFVVVQSPDLLRYRRAVAAAFRARGGDAKAFDPEHFFPHITVGYTRMDLHEEQGAIKDERACRARLRLEDDRARRPAQGEM